MKKLVLLLFVLALIVPAGWASAATPQKGGSLIIAVGDEPPGLDPTASASAAIDRVVYANIMEGLIKVDRNGQFVPGLATNGTYRRMVKSTPFTFAKGLPFTMVNPSTPRSPGGTSSEHRLKELKMRIRSFSV